MNTEKNIKFTYIKNNNFRIHHIDGLHGGLTPRGDIILNFFSERFPIPNIVIHELLEGNKIGKEIGKESKEGIIREIECGIVMNLDTAKNICLWLTEKINEIESIIKKG